MHLQNFGVSAGPVLCFAVQIRHVGGINSRKRIMFPDQYVYLTPQSDKNSKKRKARNSNPSCKIQNFGILKKSWREWYHFQFTECMYVDMYNTHFNKLTKSLFSKITSVFTLVSQFFCSHIVSTYLLQFKVSLCCVISWWVCFIIFYWQTKYFLFQKVVYPNYFFA